jgi:DNA-binding XRE family transcriptional regulator
MGEQQGPSGHQPNVYSQVEAPKRGRADQIRPSPRLDDLLLAASSADDVSDSVTTGAPRKGVVRWGSPKALNEGGQSTPRSFSIPPRIMDGDFAGWLRDSMAERGMTTRGLAMRTGINHSTISRLMRGDRDPSLATAIALLRVLGPEPLRSRLLW